MVIFPKAGRHLRWLVILYGLIVFFWLGPEDNHLWPVVLLGTAGAALAVFLWAARRLGGQHLSGRGALLLLAAMGTVIGLGSSLTTALLMFFKNARHAHLFLDYPLEMIGAILSRAPLWGLVGGLIGLGLGLVWLAVDNDAALSSNQDKPM
ncbi:MAG: hypothetical protein OHK0046_29570 [Anaerolineae bacterium]